MGVPLRIVEEQLRACLDERYDLGVATLEFLPVGRDYNAGVYRVVSEQGVVYLLKVTSRPLYEARYVVPRYLHDKGISAVVAPLPDRSGALWASVEEWTVSAYPFIEGITSLTGMTNEQWQEVGAIFQQIHQTMLPPVGFEFLRKETFDPTEYTRWVRAFERQHLHAQHVGDASQRALRSSWVAHQSTIHTIVASLKKLAGVLQTRTLPYVICHADLHARNLIRDHVGHVFVIDWDEVMLAPKERDFIFIRPPQAEAFFQGYGQREIDWVVLTYYQWERVMQDVIEDATNAYFRDDLAEETRAEIAQGLHESLAGSGSNLNAAYAAAAHLPSELTVHPG